LGPRTADLDPLDRARLAGSVTDAARALLGVFLVRADEHDRRVGRIVETEAYAGAEDRASHARFGRTARNAVMADPPGTAYVYLVYGMYDCLNVVTGPAGSPSAVLIRAVEPIAGTDRMRTDRMAVERRRRATRDADGERRARARIAAIPAARLASGPGLVGASFGVDPRWTGVDLCDPASPLWLGTDPADPDPAVPDAAVVERPRVGVAYAGDDWASRPWRFSIAGHPSVSRAR
jgi:DNA-3-methyladenine glycosylase